MRINADFILNAPSVFGNCKFYPIIATIPGIVKKSAVYKTPKCRSIKRPKFSDGAQSGDGSLIDIYFGSIGKSIREPSPD